MHKNRAYRPLPIDPENEKLTYFEISDFVHLLLLGDYNHPIPF